MAEQIKIDALIRSDLDTGNLVKKVSNIQQLLKKINLPPSLQKEFDGLFGEFNESIGKINEQFAKGFETKGAVKSLDTMTSQMKASVEKIAQAWQSVSSKGDLIKLPPGQDAELKKINSEIQNLKTKLGQINSDNLKEVSEAIDQLKGKGGQKVGAQVMQLIDEGEAQKAITLLDTIIAKREKMNLTALNDKAQETFKNDTEELTKMRDVLVSAEQETKDLVDQIEQLDANGAQIMANAIADIERESREAEVTVDDLADSFKKTDTSIRGAAQGAQEMSSEMDEIKNRIKYFFSLSNAIQLVRQALRQTFEAAKELDAAMTETAVVTDFSVGDMWNMLPEYTKTAQELGATTQGVYETLTLFYQQGLDTNEAMALGVETLKMARIANMDYEEATSKMTAALRGFNMELNELSAQRVNDVYSELAAITAADTDQIATAMTKTASIANSANMEFETTAAFLSQIIETTQESAETAGTAMKTVIARFTELKKDPSLIGEVDGEIVDANKIETALKSIGVALRDNVTGQFRDLDDVFLDISKKWSDLDTNTQRYIATIAAGSRQQSRFIAMMSDYGRTIELVNAANASSGSSSAQFDKTLDSMEAKLNQLKNTGQEFALGLVDPQLLKGAIDALNSLLATINKLTNLPGILGSASKAFLGFFALFTGKKMIDVFSVMSTSLRREFVTQGKESAIGFGDAFKQEFGKSFKKLFAKTIELPIPEIDKAALKTFDEARDSLSELNDLENNVSGLKTLNAENDEYIAGLQRRITSMDAAGRSTTSLQTSLEQAYDFQRQTNTMIEEGNSILQQSEQVRAKSNSLLQIESQYKAASARQQGAFNAAMSQGATVQQASILLTKEATKEDYKQIAAQVLGKEATEEETEALAENMMAQQLSNNATQMGILTKAKYVALLLLGGKNARAEAAAKLAEAGSTWAAKMAQDGLNSAFLACPIGWIVAGIAAIVVGLIALEKATDKISLEEQLEELEGEITRAKEAAEEAKAAYDNLTSGLENYENFRKELDSLTIGTLQWKEALYQANEEILKILQSFPELAKYLGVGENGLLSLDAAGLEAYREEQKRVEQVANTNVILQQIKYHETEGQIYTDNKARNQWVEDTIDVQNKNSGSKLEQYAYDLAQQLGNVVDDLEQGGVVKQAIGDWLQENVVDGLYDLGTMDNEGINSDTDLHNAYLSLERQIREGASVEEAIQAVSKNYGVAEEYLRDAAVALAEQRNKELSIATSIENLSKTIPLLSSEFTALENSSQLASTVSEWLLTDLKQTERNAAAQVKNETYDQLVERYAELTNMTIEAVKEKYTEDDADKLKNDIVNAMVASGIVAKLDTFTQNYQGLTSAQQTQAAIVMGAGYGDDLITKDGTIDTDLLQEAVAEYEAAYGRIVTAVEDGEARLARSISDNFQATSNNVLSQLSEGGTTDSIDSETMDELVGQLSLLPSLYGNAANAAKEWELISQQGSVAQAGYLAELQKHLNAVADEEQFQAMDAYQSEILELQTAIANTKNDVVTLNQGDNEIKLSTEQAQKRLDDLQNKYADLLADFDANPVDIKVEIDGIESYADTVTNALSLIDEGFRVNRESFELLMDTFPQVLEGATVLADGQIQLNEAVVTDTVTSEKAKVRAAIESEIIRIRAAIETAEADRAAVAAAGAFFTDEEIARQLINGDVAGAIETANKDSYDKSQLAAGIAYTIASASAETAGENQENNAEDASDANITAADNANRSAHTAYSAMIDYANAYKAAAIEAAYATQAAGTGEISASLTELSASKPSWQPSYQKGSNVALGDGKSNNNKDVGSEAEKAAEEAKADLEGYLKNYFQEANGDKTIQDQNAAILESYQSAIQGALSAFDNEISSYYNAITSLQSLLNNIDTSWDQLLEGGTIDSPASGDSDKSGGSDSGSDSGSEEEEEEKWEFEREYDENIKAQLQAAQIKQEGLEAEYTKLINDENSTLEDIINAKAAIADVLKEQYELIQEQYQQDLEQVEQLRNEHPEWSNLYEIDKNGAITWDERAINNLGLTKEQGEEFEKWMERLTTAQENSLRSYVDALNKVNEITEVLDVILNDYGELYNLELKINHLAEERARLETEYNLLIKEGIANFKTLVSNLQDQKILVQQQYAAAQAKKTLIETSLNDYVNREANQEYKRYYNYDAKTGMYSVNSAEMDKLAAQGDENAYGRVTDFLEKILELQEADIDAWSEMLEAQEALLDFEKSREDAALELEQRYYDAIVQYMENQINETKELYDTIDNSNSRILSAIQESLQEQRQARNNEKSEQELTDMRNRLAYLQMNTSGANQSEILSLQKQIKEKEEDYTDTLIDQKINELEKQNDEAAEQRNRQIELLEWSHNQAVMNGDYLAEAKRAVLSVIGAKGDESQTVIGAISTGVSAFQDMFPTNKSLLEVLNDNRSGEPLKTKTELDEDVMNVLALVAQSSSALEERKRAWQTESGHARTALRLAEGLDDPNKLSLMDFLMYDVDSDGKITKADAEAILKHSVGLREDVSSSDARSADRIASGLDDTLGMSAKDYWFLDVDGDSEITELDAKNLIRLAVGLSTLTAEEYAKVLEEEKALRESIEEVAEEVAEAVIENVLENAAEETVQPGLVEDVVTKLEENTKIQEETVQVVEKGWKHFEWMWNQFTPEKYGDHFYEFHFNVDKMSSDYDVDQLADRVKNKIAEESNYRGVHRPYRRR